jgi:Ribulose-5-phosphate 4-epimerase and related epimerases and aldolases
MKHSEENQVVMHTHTREGMAVAGTKEGLLPISMFSTSFYKRLAYHEYEGPSLFLDERERLLESLGDKKAMILKNHGFFTAGRTVPDFFGGKNALYLSCQIQVDAGAIYSVKGLSDKVICNTWCRYRCFDHSYIYPMRAHA